MAGTRNSNHNFLRQIPGHWPRAAAGPRAYSAGQTLPPPGRGQMLELPGKILMDEQDTHDLWISLSNLYEQQPDLPNLQEDPRSR